eukprot:TRINITY_DN2618_c0_g2_i1.p1 TRINITY_DN2618_c0_g2~~TRINITY_DN2618_c0_g2_i1.p1  ORF type:complete len:453 (-),score=52.25 TRINITY_DN2618_c0_g2_i1:467-1825(-)
MLLRSLAQLLAVFLVCESNALGRLSFANNVRQYTCAVSRPINAAVSRGCPTSLDDGDSCTPVCSTGFAPSVGSLSCNGAVLSPSSYRCDPITCTVTCSSILGGACVVNTAGSLQTLAAGGNQMSSTSQLSVAFGASVSCDTGAVLSGSAPPTCSVAGATLPITCVRQPAANNNSQPDLSDSEVNDIIDAVIQQPNITGTDVATVLGVTGVPASASKSLCLCDSGGSAATICSTSSSSLFTCSTTCAPGCTATAQARQETGAGAGAGAGGGGGGTTTTSGSPVVVCNQVSLSEQRLCFTQAVCAGVLSTADQCPVGAGGASVSCPACDPAAPAASPAASPASDGTTAQNKKTESNRKLLLLLLLLLLIPLVCLALLFVCLVCTCARRRKSSAPPVYPPMPPPPSIPGMLVNAWPASNPAIGAPLPLPEMAPGWELAPPFPPPLMTSPMIHVPI